MTRGRMTIVSMTAAILLSATSGVFAADGPAGAAGRAPKIQVAMLLDNSGSMSGLINQAKAQLWKFVNEFATTKKNGKVPMIEVALYTYGNPPPKQIVALTDDLDLVSEKLFAVQINGGSEYCGQVIQTAVTDLAWSESNDDLKVIFIAGNEPFTQGPVDYRIACKSAITKGIIVNTIHCRKNGYESEGDAWRDGALLAEGTFMRINQNRAVAHIEAPQDKEIAKLGTELNGTYIPYGAEGRIGLERQAAQDANAAGLSKGVAVERFVTRANGQYRNGRWDLVDALQDGAVKIEDVKEDQLPENMRKMTPEERTAFVKANGERRVRLQGRINELNGERMKYVAEARKKVAEKGEETLDTAIIKTLREQAARRNFTVPAGSGI